MRARANVSLLRRIFFSRNIRVPRVRIIIGTTTETSELSDKNKNKKKNIEF